MSFLDVTVLTLFPQMFPGPLGESLAGKALNKGIWSLKALNIRDFAKDLHQTVDDTPFGGGAGMVMRPDVVNDALEAAKKQALKARVIYLSPRGLPLTQALAHELAEASSLILLCGRYEGIDERVLDFHQVEHISIGDFVLSGGEIAAFVLIDACVRLLPNVMNTEESFKEESFQSGLLEYPHYTRPQEWNGMKVPEVLLSGHHLNIKRWRLLESEKQTQQRRPDLWAQYVERKKGLLQ